MTLIQAHCFSIFVMDLRLESSKQLLNCDSKPAPGELYKSCFESCCMYLQFDVEKPNARGLVTQLNYVCQQI